MRMRGLQSRTLATSRVVTRGRTRRRRLLIQVNAFLSYSLHARTRQHYDREFVTAGHQHAPLHLGASIVLWYWFVIEIRESNAVQKELRMKTWLPDPRSAWPRDAHDGWQ